MAFFCLCSSSSLLNLVPVFLFLVTVTKGSEVQFGYTSIFNFGDSLSDTGNRLYDDQTKNKARDLNFGQFPYGETYFHQPTGRFSDGRLIIDFIAETVGLPLLPPYLGNNRNDFRQGVNFAVAGATALDNSFFIERGIEVPTTYSLGDQVEWFKKLLPTICNSYDDCRKFFKTSLFLVGEIGGNDYNNPFLQGKSVAEIRTFVPQVIEAVSSAINMLIEAGAETLVVPGNLPIGCSAAYLTRFKSLNENDYDAKTGCLNWLNKFSKYHNDLLLQELDRLKVSHPHATIIYADYYNAAMHIYRSPNQLGFKGGALKACCGGTGPYNYDPSVKCGGVESTVCEDPSLYVSWDGIHLTEAAYSSMATYLLSSPSFSNLQLTTTVQYSGQDLLAKL